MSKIKNENYITIQGWMINELNLKGNELLVYATIYGFSQTENQLFTGSLQYLADWTNSSKQGVQKNLKSLIDKGYIGKNDKFINGVKFCEYYTTKFNEVSNKVVEGMQQSCIPPIQQSCNNNIDINNINNSIDNNIERKKKESAYDEIINKLVNDPDIKEGLYEFIKMRKLIKKPLTDRALKNIINKLFILSTDKIEQIEILNQSIERNWLSLFPLKQDNNYGLKRKEVVPDWMKKPKIEIPDELKEYNWLEDEETPKEIPDELKDRVAALKEKLQK